MVPDGEHVLRQFFGGVAVVEFTGEVAVACSDEPFIRDRALQLRFKTFDFGFQTLGAAGAVVLNEVLMNLEERSGEAEACGKVPFHAGLEVGEFVRIEAFIAQIGELLTTLWQEGFAVACVE